MLPIPPHHPDEKRAGGYMDSYNIKQIRTVEGVEITPCYRVEGPPQKPFLAMTEPPNGSAF
jgi:hypothetical protein